jgi:hypothetical protein
MLDVHLQILNSEKLTKIFGYWPSFHDAEVLEMYLSRGNVKADKNLYDFPFLILKLFTWELTKDVNPQGYVICQKYTLVTLKFGDIDDFVMQGFNHQNALFEISIEKQERKVGVSPYFQVELNPAFGMGSSFKCLSVQVIDAIPCTEAGDVI